MDSQNNHIEGNNDFLSVFTEKRTILLEHSHSNFFTFQSYGFKVSYSDIKNGLQYGYLNTNNGLNYFKLFSAPLDQTYTANAIASTPLSDKIPINLDLKLGYSGRKYSTSILDKIVNTKENSYSLNTRIHTFLLNPMNFEIISDNRWYNFRNDFGFNKGLENHNKFGISYKNKSKTIGANIYFTYVNNFINHKLYSRRNFGIKVDYTVNNHMELSLKGDNFDDLFNLFENKSFYSTITNTNGVNIITNSNRMINYIMLTLKYKFY